MDAPTTLMGNIMSQTPLLVYLWGTTPNAGTGSPFTTWLLLLFVSNAVSLVIDDVDVARFVLGDGQLPP